MTDSAALSQFENEKNALANDFNAQYYILDQEEAPEVINKAPFHVFAMIDGHRGQ